MEGEVRSPLPEELLWLQYGSNLVVDLAPWPVPYGKGYKDVEKSFYVHKTMVLLVFTILPFNENYILFAILFIFFFTLFEFLRITAVTYMY